MNRVSKDRLYKKVMFNLYAFRVFRIAFIGVVLYGIHMGLNAQEIPRSFSTSVKWMIEDVYKDNHKSFYCGCAFDDKQLTGTSCGYIPKDAYTSSGSVNTRAFSIEGEHVVPVSRLATNLMCWGDERKDIEACYTGSGSLLSGRACCARVNDDYLYAQNDLVNLVPAIGQVNNQRSDKLFGEVTGEPRDFGMCDVEITDNIIEPDEPIRGDIARIHFYMVETYGPALGIGIEDFPMDVLRYWDLKDPVSAEEIERNKRICTLQGKGNRYVGTCDN